jgi:hypothetical protein
MNGGLPTMKSASGHSGRFGFRYRQTSTRLPSALVPSERFAVLVAR